MRAITNLLLLILMLVVGLPVDANEITPEELERWFNSDEFEPPRYAATQVNSGGLQFLEHKPQRPVHHHHNSLTILPHSLDDGWVRMNQCHQNMDQIDRVEVVFREGRIRNLHVARQENIDRVWVEDNSVQLEGVKKDATLCISGWARALLINDDGSFTLHSGPFMRRFLDGYFPMRVSLDVQFVGTGLKVVEISPPQQTGFVVSQKQDSVSYDAWFEGKLKTMIHFSADIL